MLIRLTSKNILFRRKIKKLKNFAIIFMLCASIFGCADPFQPPPSTIDSWIKPGNTRYDVKNALLSCGYTHMVTGYGRNPPSLEKQVKNNECMRNKGFVALDGDYSCNQDYAKEMLVCQERKDKEWQKIK